MRFPSIKSLTNRFDKFDYKRHWLFRWNHQFAHRVNTINIKFKVKQYRQQPPNNIKMNAIIASIFLAACVAVTVAAPGYGSYAAPSYSAPSYSAPSYGPAYASGPAPVYGHQTFSYPSPAPSVRCGSNLLVSFSQFSIKLFVSHFHWMERVGKCPQNFLNCHRESFFFQN